MIRPPRVRAGDAISVVAPSGPVPRDVFAAGAARLSRYRLVYDDRIFTHTGFLAGDDDARLAELERAFADPSTSAVWAARGGYGLMRLLDRLRPESFLARPKLVIGFSDVTALHGWLGHLGSSSIHGPVITQLGSQPPGPDADRDLTAIIDVLESAAPPPALTGLRSLGAPDRARGPLRGGNLEVLSRLIGTRYQIDLEGAILLIEDVGERPYRIDRILTHLHMSGALEHLHGTIVGDLVRCVEPAGSLALPGPTAEEVVVERLASLGIPILGGAPIGHGDRNRAVPLNVPVDLDGAAGTVTFATSAGD